MGRLKAVFFDLGDTIIAEINGPADVDNSDFDVLDGAEEVLRELGKSFKLAIVSNTLDWGDEDIARALERKNLTDYFDAIVTSVDAGSRKPDPGIYQKALRLVGCAPCEVAMLGDRVDTDIAGANRVGITSILCRWNDKYPFLASTEEDLPDFVIGSIKELPELIASIDGAK